ILLCCSLKLHSQNCPQSYDNGSMFNAATGTAKKICFKNTVNQDSLPYIYHSEYTVSNTNGTKLYNILFNFNRRTDSIFIVYINKITGKIASEEIHIPQNHSIRVFKDYKTNDTTVNENVQNCTLFTIPDTTRPYIILNYFRLLDDLDYYLSLEPVNKE